MALKVKHLMTIDHLEAIPYDEWHRYELIEGELYVSCAPGIPHQLVLHNLQLRLGNYLEQNPMGRLVPGSGLVFDKYNSVIPDIVFVRNELWHSIVAKNRFNAAPDLVIEIISPGPTNRSRDFNLKRKVYGKFGVPEYWIVDTWSQSVVIFRLTEDNILKEVTNLKGNDILESPLFPGLSLKLSAIFLTRLQDSEE
jgi:Uma2 family endonuclease